ncbi:iron-sulfur cluster biosynthesis family protein [Anaerobacillus isosaccharinicus]|uniref:Iron-sulfur cluster biosynthesis family protein n=1 Tax=Anaerobacillus isosaccharinicus TaxID=1532552 RepID=A0A1S2LRD6_9BACI|nr:iron-sulfur cluster biosynthesis family protein [Anaerobacillus isosaccharinicus]MBA5585538.1 iron-sulfur cluster biosynthesis family protein [Anaerobacillus isosaccharinicus]QOY36148.1 iron-sulfur cluster biosynthesis family protein [Anaerobacillus isosaccharinicus]
MQITFSIDAQNYLNGLINKDEIFVLFYDTEDCGCAVNGIPLLNIELESSKGDLVKIDTNAFELYMFKKDMIFFDDDMRIHYENNQLRLSSDFQIYTPNLAVRRMERH